MNGKPVRLEDLPGQSARKAREGNLKRKPGMAARKGSREKGGPRGYPKGTRKGGPERQPEREAPKGGGG